MLLKQARMVYRKKWASKHKCEELKGLAGTNPGNAAEADQRVVDREAPQCNEEVGRARRMGAEKIV